MAVSEMHLRHISDSGIYKSFFNNHPDAVYVLDLEGNYIDANPACVRLFGYSHDEILGRSFENLVVPEKHTQSWRVLAQLLEGESLSFETTILHKDGHRVALHVTDTPIVLDGNIVGIFGIAKNITEYKNTEKALKERSERYESLKKYNPNGVFSFDLERNVIGANPAFERITGYSLIELQAGSVFELLKLEEDVRRAVFTNVFLENVETSFKHKDGRRVDVRITTVPIIIDGKNIGIYVILEDITKQKSTEKMLNERRERYESLKKYNPNGICSVNTDGAVMGTNPAFERITGYSLNGLLGKNVMESLFWPNDLEIARKICAQVLVNDTNLRIKHKSGCAVNVNVTSVPIIIEDQQIGHYIIFEDVTEQKRTQHELLETKKLYQRLVENSRDAIGIFENGKWVFMNRAGLELFGASSENDIIGRSYYDFIHSDHHEESKVRMNIALSGHPIDVVEVKWNRLDGSVFDSESHAIPFSETSIQVIIRDSIERKHAEIAMMKAEKLTAVGQLAAGIAHEIRNPLTSLKGFTQMLHKNSTGSNTRYFEIMKSELERIEMILSEMLVLAKPQVLNFEQHHVELIVQEVLTLMSAQAALKNVVIETDFEACFSTVLCEESQLKQVFINIIKNAIEAMPTGGNLLVRLQTADRHLCIEFVDEGEGIPEDQIPKLGEPFYTTKDKGTGLGLMVTHKIVTAHHGRMEISSTVGEGTTVSIRLPLPDNAGEE